VVVNKLGLFTNIKEKMMNKKIKISLLGCTAIGSGLAQAEQTLSLHQMQYQEDEDRIKVADTSLALTVDFGVDYSLDLSLGYDSVTGASPTWQIANSGGVSNAEFIFRQDELKQGQAMTDETLLGYAYDVNRYQIQRVPLEDTRKSAAAALTIRDFYRNEWTIGVAHSKESDYKSSSVSASYLLFLDKGKNRSVNIGFAYLNDETLVFGTGYQSRTEEKIQVINFETGLTQVLSPTSVFDMKLFFNHDNGYLSNHYLTILRGIDINEDNTITDDEYFLSADSRPDIRNGFGTKLSYSAQFWSWMTGQFSYRYYQDNWNISSHTTSASLSFEVFDGLFIIPEYIRYEQSQATFYLNPNVEKPYFMASGDGSNDTRLGSFSADTYGLTISYQVTNEWQLDLAVNRYEQTNQFAASWAVLGVNYRF
jgi:hypothetical protein